MDPDDEHSLGWDPNSQRLHALRNRAPTNDDQNRSVAPAVFLATQALPLFPCFASGEDLHTTGFYRDNGEDWFSWPIWHNPISLEVYGMGRFIFCEIRQISGITGIDSVVC